MRSILAIPFVAATVLSACASQEKAPAPAAAPATAAPAPAAAAPAPAQKAPQCWNGDLGAFQDIGTKATISGVKVECKATADGKAAQWIGTKH
ncbi:MAG: hypothetical protein N2690_09920 [Rhodocyclaceae bacterium]|nr:hypothetical protein [Rhodocyclaceae bacterium]